MSAVEALLLSEWSSAVATEEEEEDKGAPAALRTGEGMREEEEEGALEGLILKVSETMSRNL